MLRPVLVTPPSGDIVPVAEVARHCRAEDVAEDAAMLQGFINAAVQHFDGWSGILGRCLLTQGWRLDLGCWPATRTIRLPFPDVSAVTTIAYSDGDDAEQTVSSSLYALVEDARGAAIRFLDGFTAPSLYGDRPDPVRVTFQAGYGTADDVPQPVKLAITMLAAHWYEHREAAGEGQMAPIPHAVDALTAPYRRVGF